MLYDSSAKLQSNTFMICTCTEVLHIRIRIEICDAFSSCYNLFIANPSKNLT